MNINIGVPEKVRNFLISRTTNSFVTRILHALLASHIPATSRTVVTTKISLPWYNVFITNRTQTNQSCSAYEFVNLSIFYLVDLRYILCNPYKSQNSSKRNALKSLLVPSKVKIFNKQFVYIHEHVG